VRRYEDYNFESCLLMALSAMGLLVADRQATDALEESVSQTNKMLVQRESRMKTASNRYSLAACSPLASPTRPVEGSLARFGIRMTFF
jgi:hypothetical protein